MKSAPANRHYESTIVSIERIAIDIFEYTIARDEAFSYQPGQYIWVALMDENRQEVGRRAFSITSTPQNRETITFITNKSESRFKTELLKRKPGDAILIVGPFGSTFLLPKDEGQPLALLAGGVGIAPFLSLIRQIRETRSSRPVYLFYTEDTPERMIYRRELEETSAHPNVHIFSSSSRLRARDIAPIAHKENMRWYVSGPQSFVDAVENILSSQNILPAHTAYEGMYPSLQKDQEFYCLFKDGKFSKPAEKISPLAQQLILIIRTIESSSNHVIITDRSGIILFANEAAEKLTGYSAQEMTGNTPRLWGGMMGSEFYKKLWQKKLSGEPAREKITNRRKNGEIYFVYSNIAPIKDDAEDHIIGWIATEEDITEIEEQRERLAKQGVELGNSKSALINILEDLELEKKELGIASAKTSAILASIIDGVVFIDEDAKIVFANDAFAAMTSQENSGLTGKRLADVITLEDHLGNSLPLKSRMPTESVLKLLNVSAPNHYKLIKKDGTKSPTVSVATPVVVDEKKIGVVLVLRDVTKEKALDMEKSEFVSIASHQLRTPLTGIRWVSEYLLKKLKLPKKSKEYLQDIHTSTARLAELLDILLNLSRIEEGAIGISPQPTEIVDFVQSYLEECRPILDKKSLGISFSSNAAEIEMETDRGALRNIIQSIISNAIEYTPAKGTISVRLDKKSDGVLVSIQDTGIGIPRDEQTKIFTKFARASNAKNVKASGTGLGAYIAKQATEMLGGTIWFTSEENRGSNFFVQLPLKSKKRGGDKSFATAATENTHHPGEGTK